MAETAHRGLVGHRLAAEIYPDETAHRLRIVERLLYRRVRQVEPLLQKIDASIRFTPTGERPLPQDDTAGGIPG